MGSAGQEAVDGGQRSVHAPVRDQVFWEAGRCGASVGRGAYLMIEFRVLGSLEVVDEDRPLALGSPQQRQLLAVLLLHPDQQVSSDRLIDALWGEQAPPSAIKIVQGYVSNLRKALGDGLLVTRGHGYVLQTQPGQIDVERFESLVAEGRRALQEGDARTAVARLGGALGLWRGPPLADFAYEQFAQGEIARLEEARLGALEDRIDAELMLGDHRGVVGELEVLVGEHPHRERLLGQLMLALYRAGRQADALAAYRRGRESLGEELGLEPGPELRALEQRILTHDPGLDAPAPTATVTGAAPKSPTRSRAPSRHKLVAAGGALLLAAAIAAGIVELAGGGSIGLRAAANSVAAIDTRSNRVVAQVPVGARPSAIASGFGSLWVANLDDQSVSRVDLRTLRMVQSVSVGAPPTGIAAAGGRVWVVASNPSKPFVSVRPIDPQFNEIGRPTRIGTVVTGDQVGVAARGDALWVAPSSGELTRLDPVTGRTIAHLDPNGGPTGIGVGADAVWVSDSDASNVIRVDSTGLAKPIPVGDGPSGIAVGNGSVWVAETYDDAVVRIDPSSGAVKMTIQVGRSPTGVAIGAGSVWVANSGDGTVTRIDPKTNKTTTIAVGGSPQAITVTGDRAWVTVDAQTIPPTGSRPAAAPHDSTPSPTPARWIRRSPARWRRGSCTRPARSSSTTPTSPVWPGPGSCPRSRSRYRRAQPTARATRSRSARASGSRRRQPRRSPPRRSRTRSNAPSTRR